MNKTDPVSQTDAYCKLYFGRYVYTTHVVSGSLKPVFNVLYDFPVEIKDDGQMTEKEKELRIECYDSERVGTHTCHGILIIPSSEFKPNETVSGWRGWTKKVFSPDGKLNVSFTYFPDLN